MKGRHAEFLTMASRSPTANKARLRSVFPS